MDTKIDRPNSDCEGPSRKPELRKLKPNQKTLTAKAQAEKPSYKSSSQLRMGQSWFCSCTWVGNLLSEYLLKPGT